MKQKECYVGFPPLPSGDEIVHALVHDPPDIRWRVVRDLFRIKEAHEVEGLIRKLAPYLNQVDDFRVKYRVTIALQALHHRETREEYILVKGRGVVPRSDPSLPHPESGEAPEVLHEARISPIVDFHIHPKMPDRRFFTDMKEAGVTHAVILATDTDPADLDRREVVEKLRRNYEATVHSQRVPLDRMLRQIRASLYSPTHVTNHDVADWAKDYPDQLIAFGSVNLSKPRDYVEKTLDEIRRLRLRGIKLLPYAQFFDPSENENVTLLFEYCREHGWIVLSHSGCGAGPFEILELSRDANPALWDPVLKKYPDVPLVLAHCGAYSSHVPGIWLAEAFRLGKTHKNVYADLAAVDWLLDREIVVKEIRKTIGFDRILFGTDYPLPLTAGVSLSYLVGSLKANRFLTEREKGKVLGQNAGRLLRLGFR
ncbi:MAG: amidohydrolase family protein [Thermodesulfobacteriota bacterium]